MGNTRTNWSSSQEMPRSQRQMMHLPKISQKPLNKEVLYFQSKPHVLALKRELSLLKKRKRVLSKLSGLLAPTDVWPDLERRRLKKRPISKLYQPFFNIII